MATMSPTSIAETQLLPTGEGGIFRSRLSRTLKFLAAQGLFASVYFIAGQLGLTVPFTSGNVSPVWPASGVALAIVALCGYEAWPALALGAFLVNFFNSIPWLPALALGLGNSASAVLGGYILRRLAVRASFDRLKDVSGFVIAAGISPIIAASVGTTALFFSRIAPWSGFIPAWRVWWLGDVTGILLVAPLVLGWRGLLKHLNTRKILEFGALSLGLLVISRGIFQHSTLGHRDDVLAFLVFPFVLWAAVRFRVAGAAIMTFMIVGVTVWATAEGMGPFVRNNPLHNVALLQVFVAVLSVTGLALSAVVSEREEMGETLSEQANLLDLANDAIFVRSLDDTITYWNQGAEQLYGWTRQEVLGKPVYEILGTESRNRFSEIRAELLRNGAWQGELVHTRRDGEHITVSSRWSISKNRRGRTLGFLQINTDITERKNIQDNLATLSARLLKVQDEERRRIARELHDSLGQYLTAAKIELDLIQKSSGPVSPDDVREASSHIERALAETRTISYLLHPPLLDEAGFVSAAQLYIDEFGKRSAIKASFTISMESCRLARSLETTLFRVLQESLTNVHRHSGSRDVEVQVRKNESVVALSVKDCGRGISPHLLEQFNRNGSAAGVGLAGIRERMKEIGGTFEIESSSGGTTITVTVPVQHDTSPS